MDRSVLIPVRPVKKIVKFNIKNQKDSPSKWTLCNRAGPEVIKLFSCSTQLSTQFQLLTKPKIRQIKKLLAFSLLYVVFIMLINVKMPTIVGILTFISRINFVLSYV